jgi:hypothetical protein
MIFIFSVVMAVLTCGDAIQLVMPCRGAIPALFPGGPIRRRSLREFTSVAILRRCTLKPSHPPTSLPSLALAPLTGGLFPLSEVPGGDAIQLVVPIPASFLPVPYTSS